MKDDRNKHLQYNGAKLNLKQSMHMRLIYTVLMYLILPFILIRLYFKGRKNHAYRARIKERFMWHAMPKAPVDVWVHAVSMGEVVASKTLIEHWLEKGLSVLVTTMTPTGSAQVIRSFGARVLHQYVPYDFPWVVRRFFKKYTPAVGVIMETEIWPNLIAIAGSQGVKLYLANGRISDKAFPMYQKTRWFFKPLWKNFLGIFTQSALDKKRFCALGVPEHKVSVLGNMKSDLYVSPDVSAPLNHLKVAWGASRPVMIAASTHEGEEEALLKAYCTLQAQIPNIILLIAPRHPERFEVVYSLTKQLGFKLGRRSETASLTSDTEVVVLDCLGELLGFYGLSDYAFVGGSLVSIGGHNVLEPIALQVPVVCGPFMQNTQEVCDELVKVGAIMQVCSADEVMSAVAHWHESLDMKDEQVLRASTALRASQGSVARHIERIREGGYVE